MVDRTVVVRLLADTGEYGQNMRGAARDTRGVGEAGDETGKKLEGLKGILATIGAGAIIKTGIDLNALKQNAEAAFTTLSGSSKDARTELATLQKDFGANPFGFENIIKAGQRLTAMGVPLGDLNKKLLDISDATAAVGGDSEVFDRISMSIGQMLSKGTVQAEEMMQLAEAGIPAWQLLAKEIGTTVPEAMKKVQNRQVSSDVGVAALMKGIEDRFGGATKNAENTWTGMLARLKSETAQAAGEIAAPLMRIGTEGAEAAKPVLQGVGAIGNAFTGLPQPIQNTALTLGAVALFAGRLNGVWSSGVGVATRFGQAMDRQQYYAARSGVQIGRLNAGASVLRANMGGVARAGGAVAGAFGGPLGLAITGAALGLSIYQDRQQKAAAAVEQHKQEVLQLSAALDKSTLSLNRQGQGEQIDTFLARKATVAQIRVGGTTPVLGQKVEMQQDKSIFDYLQKWKISADLVRKAILGDKAAMAEFKREAIARGTIGAIPVIDAVVAKSKTLGESVKQAADEYRTRLAPAAEASGAAQDKLSVAIDRTVGGFGSLPDNLRAVGLDSNQAAIAFGILSNSADAAGSAASRMGYNFAAAKADIAKSASGFVDITGAWTDAVSANQAAFKDANKPAKEAKQAPLPKLEDDPRYAKAKKTLDDYERQQKKQERLDQDRVRAARKAADADSEAADAARDRAQAIREAANAAQDAARDAEDALKTAQEQKEKADRNAHDAAALAAAVRDQALRAGDGDRGAYASASATANTAAAATAKQRDTANAELIERKADFAAKDRAAKRLKWQAESAESMAKKLKDVAEQKRKDLEGIQQRIDDREAASAALHDRLQDAQQKAEKKFNTRLNKLQDQRDRDTAKSNTATSTSYGTMASSVSTSLSDYLKQLRKQVDAQRKWKDDLLLLAAKIPPGMVAELAKLGPQAAPLIDKLASGTKTQLRDFVSLFGAAGDSAGLKLSEQITAATPLISSVAETLGSKAAGKLASAIAAGKTTVQQAMNGLQAKLDNKTMKIVLGIKDPKKLQDALGKVLAGVKPPRYRYVTKIVDGSKVTFAQAYARGGWVNGGSGYRDDVPIPNAGGGRNLVAMGGEFMVRKDIAQRNKPFFDQMDRTGRMPQQQPQVVMPMINFPAQAPSKQVVNHITVYQQPGQSPADLLREMDRLADTGMGPG